MKYGRKPNHGQGPSIGAVTVKLNTEEHTLLSACVQTEGKSGSEIARRAIMRDVRRMLRRRGVLEQAIQRAKRSTSKRLSRSSTGSEKIDIDQGA